MAETYWRCADCEACPVPKGEPVQHDAACPHVTVPERVTDAEIVETAREMANLFRRTSTGPWWRTLVRLVVMCERERTVAATLCPNERVKAIAVEYDQGASAFHSDDVGLLLGQLDDAIAAARRAEQVACHYEGAIDEAIDALGENGSPGSTLAQAVRELIAERDCARAGA